MIRLADTNVLIGGFHEHWHRIDAENTAYLMAALDYYNFDFVTLMDGAVSSLMFKQDVARFTGKISLYQGLEYGCPWGHVVAVGFKNNCDEEQLVREIADIKGVDDVFARLKEAYDLVILAHPDYDITWREIFLTGELDRLLDENIIDGVNIINSGGFNYKRHKMLIEWYHGRESVGKATPIVSGWDAHLIMNKLTDPDILYTSKHPAKGHIDTAGVNRSVLIGAENNLDSIIAAVKECRMVIEDIETGAFVGPAKWIDFLQKNNYRAEIENIENKRNQIVVSKNKKWFLGEPAEIIFNQSGTVAYPTGKDSVAKKDVEAGKLAVLDRVDLGLVRDEVGIPVVFTARDGYEAIFAIRASHQIRLDVVPKFIDGQEHIQIIFFAPFTGKIHIESPIFEKPEDRIINEGEKELLIAVDYKDTDPVEYMLYATNKKGVSRSFNGLINFYPVKPFDGDWEDIPKIHIDSERFVSKERGYANTMPWLGAELFSGIIQVSWTLKTLEFRIDVTDPIHDQPLEGHFLYDADCVQIAIDPLYLRRDYRGHFYNYNLALTKKGPELFQMFTPDLDEYDNPVSMPEDRSLGGKYLRIEKTEKGLIYNLSLPWELVGCDSPEPGKRIGIYFVLLNSNGNGVINNLKWPVQLTGMWMIPNKWGTLSLVD